MPITITSRFKPLTYDEITKPLIEQTQAQHELEDAYMAAQDQVAQIMAQANEQTDPQSYTRLKNYANAIKQQADVLMQQGLNRNSRQSLLNLHRRYGQDIMPIQLAATRRSELAEEQRKMQLQHPDMLFERDASTLSLDDLVRNPQMNYGQTVIGSDISKRAATLTAAIGKGRQQLSLGQNIDPYTKQILVQSGLTTEEIQAALAGDNSVLDKALGSLYNSTGVGNWSNTAAQNAVRGYIQEGALSAVGSLNISTSQDHAAIRRDQLADRREDREFQAALYGLKKDANGNWVYDPNQPGPRSRTTSSAKTDTGEDIEIESVGKHSKKYGTIYMDVDGVYYRKNGKSYTPIADQDDARNEFENGVVTSGVSTAVQQKRDNWSAEHPGHVMARRVDAKADGDNLDNDAADKALRNISDDSDFYDGTQVGSMTPREIAIVQDMLKDSGYNYEDVYIIRNRKWHNKIMIIPKEYIDSPEIPEYVRRRLGIETTQPVVPVVSAPQAPKVPSVTQQNDSTTVRESVVGMGLN